VIGKDLQADGALALSGLLLSHGHSDFRLSKAARLKHQGLVTRQECRKNEGRARFPIQNGPHLVSEGESARILSALATLSYTKDLLDSENPMPTSSKNSPNDEIRGVL